jgi:hypothetical protein
MVVEESQSALTKPRWYDSDDIILWDHVMYVLCHGPSCHYTARDDWIYGLIFFVIRSRREAAEISHCSGVRLTDI